MPNYDVHAGLGIFTHPELGIEGAAGQSLDDIIRMSGGMPGGLSSNHPVKMGVKSNQVVDEVFDSHPLVKGLATALKRELEELGLPDSLHLGLHSIGHDIAFSAPVAQITSTRHGIGAVCDWILDPANRDVLTELITPRGGLTTQEVLDNVLGVAQASPNVRYQDPEYVMERTIIALSRRGAGRWVELDPKHRHLLLGEVASRMAVRVSEVATQVLSDTVRHFSGDLADQM